MHEHYLKQALNLARRRQGWTAPNPPVGAVIVNDNRILAVGFHYGSGYSHAEIEALADAGNQAKNAFLYLTLEPCCHWGKTPPCTQAIITIGIKQVIYAFQDPDPRVAGMGQQTLEKAGIACIHYPLPEIDKFYGAYAYWQQQHMPWVTAKLALSLDGKIAGPNRQPTAITGPALQRFTHKQRRRHDAILTTAQTINCDNPKLNIRFKGKNFVKPLYIVDTQLKISDNALVLQQKAPIIVFHGYAIDYNKASRLAKQGIRLVEIAYADKKGLDLAKIFKQIAIDGYHSVWVEAGATLFNSLLLSPWLKRAYLYVGACYVGPEGLAADLNTSECFAGFTHFQIHAAEQEAYCELWR